MTLNGGSVEFLGLLTPAESPGLVTLDTTNGGPAEFLGLVTLDTPNGGPAESPGLITPTKSPGLVTLDTPDGGPEIPSFLINQLQLTPVSFARASNRQSMKSLQAY